MHPALLIDEILQSIFEFVLDDSKSTLCRIARCCQAWKEPAIEHVWRRLPSAVPLFSLLPGFSVDNDTIRFDTTAPAVTFMAFHSYALRVRHITHRHRVAANLASIPTHLHQLHNLESARIESRAISEIALRISLAPRLRSLALQVGYTKSRSAPITVHGMVALLKGCPSLEQLSIRGHSSESLHTALSSVTTLRSLALHLSTLTGQTLIMISTFPRLSNFDIHAERLSRDCLSVAVTRTCDTPFFPALEKLKIRAQPALVELLLQRLPRNKLCSLHIDAAGSGPASTFDDLFTAMSTLPLHEFTLEHAVSIDDIEDAPTDTLDRLFTLDHLRPLSKLSLRSFILDTSLPPDLSDPAVEEMTKWWPRLERLQLGAHNALENVVTSWEPRTSLASLSSLAKGCRHLEHLAIVLDAATLSLPDLDTPISHPLASLSISSRSRPDVAGLSTVLSRLFPSLVGVTPGFVGEHEDVWDAVQITVTRRLGIDG